MGDRIGCKHCLGTGLFAARPCDHCGGSGYSLEVDQVEGDDEGPQPEITPTPR